MTGYIKDHRKELESDIWLMPPLYHRTWQWLKYNVNHSDNEIPMRDGSKMLIKRGQRLTSVRDIAKGISWYEGTKYKEPNPKTISSILEWMVKMNMILISRGQGNREYTLISLINYEVYNEKEIQGNSKVTVSGEGREQRADINNNDKECLKNDKEISTTVNPFRLFESEGFGTISGTIADKLGHMIDEYGERWVCEAMKIAVYRNKRSLGYVDGILKSFQSSGVDQPWLTELAEVKPTVVQFKTKLEQEMSYLKGV